MDDEDGAAPSAPGAAPPFHDLPEFETADEARPRYSWLVHIRCAFWILAAWLLLPATVGAETLVFRETLVGVLPRGIRQTWTMTRSGSEVRVVVETSKTKGTFPRLDRTTHAADRWLAPHRRVEYAGTVDSAAPRRLELRRIAGDATAPETLSLRCAERALVIHPAFAELVEGWLRDDDSMEPASWAPPRTAHVGGTVCSGVADTLALPFTKALYFVPAGKKGKEDFAGVEWGFNNSDMVIQEGGLRFIPTWAR